MSAAVDYQVEQKLEDPDDLLEGWWCVATKPFNCPAEGCSFVAKHLTAAHLVVVWADIDDRWLLSTCIDAQRLGRDPRVVRYRPDCGAAINFYEWMANGTPVHAQQARPDHVPRNAL